MSNTGQSLGKKIPLVSDTLPLLQVKELKKNFDLSGDLLDQFRFRGGRIIRHKRYIHAVNDVSLEVMPGEALCVVGESGCGKSTVARLVMGLLRPTRGSIYYRGQRIDKLSEKALLPYRKKMQMIFQNPYASLNPRMTIDQALLEPIRFHNPDMTEGELRERKSEVIKSVGMDPSWGNRYPHEFSGGQRQRISIARALMVDPEFIVADEPLSALDVSIQAQVLNLLRKAQQQRGLTYLFITHDLAVVEHFGSRVAVMYLGTVCEVAATKTLFSTPKHPYTQALLSSVPRLWDDQPRHISLPGEVPTQIGQPKGCVFQGRCPHANDRCRRYSPQLNAQSDGSLVACHGIEEGRI
ncbi:ABC transporter ATP-binding protein [Motiliproteus sp. MSK22-1]|uniref:ABC transporter ATP-binding protein n=1 Tax=Motiliproteus sp. MSK22-1 TaxID=1897630 RepID=UPI000976BB91|nr:oligopeptide/dipeptide ABC transporter ATP-binding protein [Motiliproteus sp. MSK22-1]OMH38369.1 ABC transporter ATP-binding protein [Motiliproteus sp. MSK22-1]